MGVTSAPATRPIAAIAKKELNYAFRRPRTGPSQIFAPWCGFFSAGHLAAHERKFERHLKHIVSESYRQFESPLVRQQVFERADKTITQSVRATFPRVSVQMHANSKLRAWITPHCDKYRDGFSEQRFSSPVLLPTLMRFRFLYHIELAPWGHLYPSRTQGEKPADLPLQQATRIINLETAKALGIALWALGSNEEYRRERDTSSVARRGD